MRERRGRRDGDSSDTEATETTRARKGMEEAASAIRQDSTSAHARAVALQSSRRGEIPEAHAPLPRPPSRCWTRPLAKGSGVMNKVTTACSEAWERVNNLTAAFFKSSAKVPQADSASHFLRHPEMYSKHLQGLLHAFSCFSL